MEQFSGTKIRPDVVITGEAIALLVQPASLFLRVAAAIVDAIVVILGMIITYEILFLIMELRGDGDEIPFFSNEAQVAAFISIVTAVWLFLVPMLVETLTRGKSLGRFIVGTRIVRDDGGPITLRHAFVRTLIGLGELWMTMGAGAIIAAWTNRRGKRIGDIFAGTYAVSEASGVTRRPLLMAPELADWAGDANVGELDGVTTVAARRFLQSATKMDPIHRQRTAQALATALVNRVYPPPPPGTDPERFIAAVLVLRRDAEYRTNAAIQARLEQRLSAVSGSRYGI
ncbi:RDD family protein [Mobiluncus curtisii]|uniref:RDD family protein n=1 Tax=Mobiluncus curtisii TaxID=2051 RepID=UPI0001E0BD06|nr:RDD family protein [Mobiluncus curtisii]EFL93759.1 RDD family protein [Mobiluncus curtisii subsp. curtisii ATCC 35241]NMW45502.1 RDD family protein [Mobiluncus curtisii]QQT12790.1 RDD family protein [Mobiluncus curtisii]STY77639.1 RDD family [Mobiluncus curtisii subsp. curtisii]